MPPTSSVIDIVDDDDDGGYNERDLPSNGLKRKLSSSEIPHGENEGNNSGENRSKQLNHLSYTSVNNLPLLRQRENKAWG